MGRTAVKTQQDVKHCEFSPNWLNKGQEFFLTAEEENFPAITQSVRENGRGLGASGGEQNCSFSTEAFLPVQDAQH